MTHASTRNLVLLVLAGWLATVILLAAKLVFDSGQLPGARGPLPLGIAVVLPIVVFLLWYASSPTFRNFVLSLNPEYMTIAQTWRIGGFVFVALAAGGLLPHTFANVAGWGDVFIGVTAPFAAYGLVARRRMGATILWQALGMLDLISAIALGVLSSPTDIGFLAERGVTTRVMGLLPMSLVPTFIVPLLFIFHIVCIVQARKWVSQSETNNSGMNRGRTHSAQPIASY